MPLLPLAYVGYADGASRHTRRIASAAWVLYTPESDLLVSEGIFLGNTTNNVAEYMSVIQLLTEVASRDISNLVFRLDSQFQTITFEHIPREFNTLADSLENYVLDWNLSHLL